MTQSFIRVLILMSICTVCLAGDIATERTQVATAAIIAEIQTVNEDIQAIEEGIKEFERQASILIDELPDFENLPGVEDVFTVLRQIEQVVIQGQALGHTFGDLETFMTERFDTYETYLDIIENQWGELDEGQMRAKFQKWNETHQDTIQQTLIAHGIHAEQIDTAEARLATLQSMSRSADGRMQALQIGQEIATEEIKQLHQLKAIIMEQSNLHASYFAVRQAMQAESEAVNTWLQRELNPTILGNEQGLPLP